jgi:hypothetical protein
MGKISVMTATQIIEEIKQLPPKERAEVESFVRHDDSIARLSPTELGALAKSMAETADDNKAAELEEKIIAGFYRTK